MKNFILIFAVFFSVQTGYADNWKEYLTPDTLKTPEASDLSQKQIRQLGSSQLGSDFTLSTTKRKADELFKYSGYMASVSKYEKLEGIEQNKFVMSKLANGLLLNGEYEKAEYYYSQFINDVTNPEDYLHYAEVLQINGKCEDATRWNRAYLAVTLDTGRDIITDCDQLNDIPVNDFVKITNFSVLNSEGLDFSPILFKEGVVFTSDRGVGRLTKKVDLWSKDNFTDLFYAQLNEDGIVGEVESLANTVNHKLHDGTATFSPDGSKMIFSRTDEKGKNTKGIKESQLYFTEFEDEEWSEAQKLSICSSKYAYSHPAISENGKKIYFTSNQMPGGYGGMDIWVSERKEGEWKQPVNLGPNVNTSGNELFPFFATDEILYFASNGHRGLGGLDIFYVKQEESENDRTWSSRTNLGEPFNGNKDDFGFNVNEDNTRGFFTSNRGGGQGKDDIYKWSGHIGAAILETKIVVIDKKEKRRLPFVNVIVVNRETGDKKTLVTKNDGTITMPIDLRVNYFFQVEKPGFLPYDINISGKEMLEKKTNTLELDRLESFVTTGAVLNLKTREPLANASVKVVNSCTGKVETLTSNALGQFDFTATCNCTYEIYGEKDSFNSGTTIFSTIGKDCSDLVDPTKKNEVSIDLAPIELSIYEYSTDEELDGSLNRYFLGEDDIGFEVGQVIRLSNLYYDYDKYDIRPDAKQDLDRVYDLLKAYKTMRISLLSHTDSRGGNDYNATLSQKRALSARSYLILKGISPNRLGSIGVGEDLPVNGCINDVDCNEDEHQLNRRTEIQITALKEPGIRVIRD
ncbi:MAG: outer membrane protein OmpA-like peptidoglycan-associated protein [Saprospiraceae bacterium]|jgi:outer membrane protein OmpA-like peptidoglycan-associated protein